MLDYQINESIRNSYRKMCECGGKALGPKRHMCGRRAVSEADDASDNATTVEAPTKDDAYYARQRQKDRYRGVHDEVKAMFGDTVRQAKEAEKSSNGRYLRNPSKMVGREKPIEVKFDAKGKDVTNYPSNVKTDVYGNPTPAARKEELLAAGKEVASAMPAMLGMASRAKKASKAASALKGLGKYIGSTAVGALVGTPIYREMEKLYDAGEEKFGSLMSDTETDDTDTDVADTESEYDNQENSDDEDDNDYGEEDEEVMNFLINDTGV